jgi:hypothetical protein
MTGYVVNARENESYERLRFKKGGGGEREGGLGGGRQARTYTLPCKDLEQPNDCRRREGQARDEPSCRR